MNKHWSDHYFQRPDFSHLHICLCDCVSAVQSQWSLRHSSKRVCGLKGSSVVLPCRYYYPWRSESDTYQGGGWYKNQREKFREHSNSNYPDCSLKIENLSEEDSGVYHFKFYTVLHLSWITDTSGVELSITDLQVREDVVEGNQNQTKVTCSSSCSLGSYHQYVWYKNGQRLPDKTTASILLDPTSLSEVGSYSCAVRGYEANRAPAVCVPEKLCWAVKCVSTSVCTLAGTSQDISCTYRYPSDHSIHTTSWEKTREPQVDLQLAEEFHGLSQYQEKTGKVTLKVSNLKESDSGRYVLKMETTQGKVYSGSPGLTVFVTFLQVKMTPDTLIKGEIVTLTCNTTCSLSNNHTFIWYKNGQPLTTKHTTRDHKLQLNPVSSEDSGNYSCAVRGHESLSSTAVFLHVRYKPKNVSVSISASGDMGEGDTVTLTCSSDANPPVHNYTWYMKTGAESLVRGTGESISFNVTSDTSGLYYCQAQNEVGSQTSTEVAVQDGEYSVFFKMMPEFVYPTIRGDRTLLGDNVLCVHIFQNVRGVDDTYMPLQRTAQASVYETLQRRETPQTDMELQDLGMRRQRQM
ncbi:hypothetical protein ACEWY4_017896 [Coilia grayii]|uniref:B-cell receptor CD22 n=1 Tax=Coilia grayii TaxID=363190 RepID=A0ABD1JI61_9TELE